MNAMVTTPERSAQAAKQKLAQDLRTTMEDVEELLQLTAGQVGERMAEVRTRLQSSLAESRSNLAELQSEVMERGRQVTDDIEDYVRDHPWKALGIVGGACLLIGALISHR